MVKSKFNRAIHNELLCTSMEKQIDCDYTFLVQKRNIYKQ